MNLELLINSLQSRLIVRLDSLFKMHRWQSWAVLTFNDRGLTKRSTKDWQVTVDYSASFEANLIAILLSFEFSVKNMVILDSGGNHLYVKESTASFTKIGAPYLIFAFHRKLHLASTYFVGIRCLHNKTTWSVWARENSNDNKIAIKFASKEAE